MKTIDCFWKKGTGVFAAIVMLLSWSSFAEASILYVPTDYPTIQSAIEAAAPLGDGIEVAPGTYSEEINFNGKAIHLYSSGGPDVTTVNSGGGEAIISCISGEESSTIIEGFTFKSSSYEIAILVKNSRPTATGCLFDSTGIGISNVNSSPNVTECTFTNSVGPNNCGISNDNSSPSITDCTFTGNASFWGSCIDNTNNSRPIITNCTFSGNSGEEAPIMNSNSSPIVTGCTFSNNVVLVGGGITNYSNSNPIITDCLFFENRASGAGSGWGGGIHNIDSNPIITNCLFHKNYAEGGGGGINNWNSTPVITNCTFSENEAPEGGGLYNDDISTPVINNCIFWANIGGEIFDPAGSASIQYSNIQGGWPGTGNIDSDPFFVDSLNGDLHLQATSPCIDAGDNSVVTIDYDLDGNQRIADGDGNGSADVDMGVYEISGLQPVPPTIDSVLVENPVMPVNTEIAVNLYYSDPDLSDTHSISFDWGDGITSAGEATDGIASGSHVYIDPGVYTVALILTDSHGLTAEAMYDYIVVYDPSGGFVSGGGWIISPLGAYAQDTSLAGKAGFGFVSKYQKGAVIPSGQTEFHFNVANFNFQSDSYEWLLIAGAKAKYKGVGTINGKGSYKFMLTGIDAEVSDSDVFTIDRFRIKIWEEDANGSENVIYDNALGSDSDEATTELGGGSIQVHKSKK